MLRSSPRLVASWALLLSLWGLGCDTPSAPAGGPSTDAGPTADAAPPAQLAGQAWLLGPVADAPVQLVRAAAPPDQAPLAAGRTDADGRFRLATQGLPPGPYRLRAELGGTRWRYGDAEGSYPAGLILSTTLDTPVARADLSPWTTLVDVAAAALAEEAGPLAQARARAAFEAYLGLDPQRTPLGAPGDRLDPATTHRLLTDALAALPAHLGADDPGALLLALGADLHGAPAARFDGLGPAGPVPYALGHLDPEALRAPLADALAATTARPAWAALPPEAHAPLAARLRCADTLLFGPCPVPSVGIIEGVVYKGPAADVEVRAFALESPPRRLASARTDERGAYRLEITDYAGPVLLEAGVFEPAGPAQPDPPEGADAGVAEVDAGPADAAGADAAADPADPDAADPADPDAADPADPDAADPADPDAADPADPDAADPADSDAADPADPDAAAEADVAPREAPPLSGPRFHDELRGPTRWRPGYTLRALITDFDSAVEEPWQATLTPFSDLALARALRRGVAGDALIEAYREDSQSLAELLGLPADPTALTRIRPLEPRRVGQGPEAQLAFLLGCFSAQADFIAHTQSPAAPERFDALDLLALYRADVVADGRFDGWGRAASGERFDGIRGQVRLTLAGGIFTLPLDPLRRGFVDGCGRWYHHPGTPRPAEWPAVQAQLEALAVHTRSPWIDHTQQATRLSDRLTELSYSFPEGQVVPDHPPSAPFGSLIHGQVVLQIEATHPAGVVEIQARFGDSALPAPVRTSHTRRGLSTTARFELDAAQLPADWQRLFITTRDGLGQLEHQRLQILADSGPPELTASVPGVGADGALHTRGRAPLSFTVDVRDQTPVTLELSLDGEVVQRLEDVPERLSVELDPSDRSEGSFQLEILATDAFGRRSEWPLTLVIDRTPPVLGFRLESCVDEVNLPANGDREGAEPLPTADDPSIRQWVTTWAGLEGRVGCTFVYTAHDGDGTPPAALQVAQTGCLLDGGGECRPVGAWYVPLDRDADGAWRVTLRAGEDGWLPISLSGTDHARFVATATDRAGNTGRLAPPDYRLVAIAPTLEVEFPIDPRPADLPRGTAALPRLSFGSDVPRLFSGEGPALHTRRITLRNPHPIAVEAQIEVTGAAWELTATVGPALVQLEPYAGTVFESPACAYDRFEDNQLRLGQLVDVADCRLVRVAGEWGLNCGSCVAGSRATDRWTLRNLVADEGAQLVQPGRGGRWLWRTQLEPGAERTVDFALTTAIEAWRDLLRSERAHPSGAFHARELAPAALEWRRGDVLNPGGWLNGAAVEALTALRLEADPAVRWRVHSFLGGALSGGSEAGPGPPIVAPNPTLR